MIIAGAGGAAHLPGMLAAVTPLPVIGVPVPLKYLDGMDSLLSIVQMPAGVPVATVAIGNARNAGLLAVRILAAADPALQQRMVDFQDQLRQAAEAKGAAVRDGLARQRDARPGGASRAAAEQQRARYARISRRVRRRAPSAAAGRGRARGRCRRRALGRARLSRPRAPMRRSSARRRCRTGRVW